MSAMVDKRPDPLFSEAPERGLDSARYHWRRAQGTECARCEEPIEGRTWEVQLIGSAEWIHVRCVTPAEWMEGPAPRSGQGLAPLSWGRPKAGTARAEAVQAALVEDENDGGEEPTQEELWN